MFSLVRARQRDLGLLGNSSEEEEKIVMHLLQVQKMLAPLEIMRSFIYGL